MEITEEVARRRQTIKLKDPGNAYSELRDLLEEKMSFSGVHEDKYINDVDEGKVQAHISTESSYDKFTGEKIDIYVTIDAEKGEMDFHAKAKLVTEYPEKYPHHETVWYYGYRSLFDKFLYGSVREGYKPAVDEKLETLMTRLRETLEA